MEDFYERLAELIRRHPRVAVATVVSKDGSAPREAGARMAVLQDGSVMGTVGGGILEKRVTDDALEVLRDGRPRLARYDLRQPEDGGIGAQCGGTCEVFIEPTGSPPRLLVLGAGHVGLALARIAVRSGYEVIVADDRPEFTREATLVGAQGITTRPDDPALRDQVSERTAVTVLTRSHALDRESLLNVLDTPAFYIGMIGSRRKVEREMGSLLEAGADPALLDRVHAPIGLDIGAETPAEIAIAILAEIVAVRRTGRTPDGSLGIRR